MAAAGAQAVVQQFYAALEAEDVPAILALCSDDASVTYPAEGMLPYGGTWRGSDGIGRFLELHDQTEEILEFEVLGMSVDGARVFVRGRFGGRSKASGRTWQTPWIHLFDVVAGHIRRWEAFFDTAAALEAHRQA